MFLKGFEGWRHARQLQDELLDTLEAGVGADDVNLATLRGFWMVYWHLGGGWRHLADTGAPLGDPRSRAHAQVVVIWVGSGP